MLCFVSFPLSIFCVVSHTTDAAFKNPSKPIGRFYTEEESKEIKAKVGMGLFSSS